MRLLAFDFPEDPAVFDCKDEFMYGPSLLVCPVTKASRLNIQVYYFHFFIGISKYIP
jgi:alpha-D-xyloside xylohydrolase